MHAAGVGLFSGTQDGNHEPYPQGEDHYKTKNHHHFRGLIAGRDRQQQSQAEDEGRDQYAQGEPRDDAVEPVERLPVRADTEGRRPLPLRQCETYDVRVMISAAQGGIK